MTIYRGHRVALRAAHPHDYVRLVHLVLDPHAWRRQTMVMMVCGVDTLPEIAHDHITSEPLSCVWCISGIRRGA